MPLLFSYGTLQQEPVQVATFGRRLEGWRDELVGFEIATSVISDPARARQLGKTHHVNAVRNGKSDSRVNGTVFEVSDAELAAADEYERPDAYARMVTTLASGRQAWVYVALS